MSRQRNRKKPVTPVAEADKRLAREQYSGLNREFYEGFDIETLRARLMIACLAHHQPDSLVKPLSKGVEWGKLKMAAEFGSEDLGRYAELEVLSLHHHLSETLVRLFWIHAVEEPCPWLALARLRSPRELKAIASKYLDGEPWDSAADRRNGHAFVLYGCASLATAEDDRLAPSVDCAIKWLELAARTVGDAPMYNAYKHGLAILPSPEFEMTIGGATSDSITLSGGRGYQYLELKGPDNTADRWRWLRTQSHVDFAGRAAEVSVMLLLVETVLETGAVARRVKESAGLRLLVAEATPDYVSTDVDSPYFVTSFSESLAYYKELKPGRR